MSYLIVGICYGLSLIILSLLAMKNKAQNEELRGRIAKLEERANIQRNSIKILLSMVKNLKTHVEVNNQLMEYIGDHIGSPGEDADHHDHDHSGEDDGEVVDASYHEVEEADDSREK